MNRRFLKTVSAMLLLAMTLQTMPAVAMADAAVAEEKALTGTFENISENGEDMISLSEARSYKVMIPVEGEVDPADVTWTMTRNEDKPYNDAEKYPNQIDIDCEGVTLDTWKATNGKNFFSDVVTTVETVDEQTYVVATFSNDSYFYSRNTPDYSAPHANGGSYLDACGWFILTAAAGEEELGGVEVKIAPYDDFHTMTEIYADIDAMVDFAAAETDLYVERFSMGQSSGDVYEPMDMPYLIVADDASSVQEWLAFTVAAETKPTETLAAIEAGKYDDLRVPVMYSNIHANEVAAADGILNFGWMLLEAAADDGIMEYNTLTGFTAEGEAQLAAELEADGVLVPDLVKDTATYLGYLKAGNSVSGIVDLDKFYEQEIITVDVDAMLEDVFFILVPEENVEGREYVTRTASNGYDLNRDNSFQTTSETQNMQKLIGTFNPVSFTEFHGRVKTFQCEPCDPPHEPNFEYDLLAEHLMTGGEALGIVAVANNASYNSYVIPQRDYLYEGYGWDAWDDMSTSYTPQFAMLHGTVSYTVELPAYSDDTAGLVQYGCLGQADYVAGEKIAYITAQTKIYERGVTNFNSNAYELVGQWFCDQQDVEGAEMDLFRPEFDGEGQNGNFYPECYIIPMDGTNQENLQAAADMMEWLSRNDVQILVTYKAFTYNGVQYPAGTMVISMYQAKRSVANSALYDGTFIQTWPTLYSEGITTFGETRGFDCITVAEPAAYKTIKATCGSWMDYEDCLEYLADVTSAFTGVKGDDVIISNASEDSTAAINALLKAGVPVGMITDESSKYYGDFVVSYDAWLSVADDYILTGYGIVDHRVPEAKFITGAPTVFITGASSTNGSGFLYSSRVSNANWNYDRIAMELMGFNTTDDAAKADIILGASTLNGAALTAVQNGTPYIGYGSSGGRNNNLFVDALTRTSAGGMDCLAYVTYPTTTLVNASYVMDEDDVMYGYGNGYYSAIPAGAEVLVKMDGSRVPTEGFLPAGAKADAFLNDTVLAFSYKGIGKTGNEINVAMFANSLTHKVHQRDEYAFISNFIFSNMLGEDYESGELYEDALTVMPRLYTVKVNTDENVKASTPKQFLIAFAAKRTVKFTVAEGFEITDVLVNGVSVGAVDTYTIKIASRDYVIEVQTAEIAAEEAAAEETVAE
ncbi:MAG: hypothetical protein IKY52_15025 [Clostridia bacterium]|nr:hypothetical protein [Clostridia bacterium]